MAPGNPVYKSLYVLGLVFILISINPEQAPTPVEAQNSGWSTPQTIPGYDPATSPPVMIADQSQTVHAFSSEPVDGAAGKTVQAISYNQWTLAQGWTFPTDIILSPSKDARICDAHLDRKGMFHVLFFGGDGTAADIYYSQAPAANADDPHAWSAPIIIGENAGDPAQADFLESNDGSLHVVYSGQQLGGGLYEVHSKDGGLSWSAPNLIFVTPYNQPYIYELHVAQGQSGWMYAIWDDYAVSGQGRGIYYTGSKDGTDWSKPTVLASAQAGLGTQTPTIIEYNQTLFAIYNMPPKIIMRQSLDHGATWSEPAEIFPRQVGVNGTPALAIDSADTLHMLFGQRISGNPDIHGMWHSTWVNNRWTEPVAVVKGPRVADLVRYTSFDPSSPRAVVSQGNVLLVTWRTDPGLKPNGVWYSYEVLNSPELPLATPISPQQAALAANPAGTAPSSQPTPAHELAVLPPGQASETILPVAVSVVVIPLAVTVLVIGILVYIVRGVRKTP